MSSEVVDDKYPGKWPIGKFIDEMLEDVSLGRRMVIEAALGRHRGDPWWRSEDLIEIAYCQLQEDTLMVPLPTIYEGLHRLLGRPVSPEELDLEESRLKVLGEIEKAITIYLGEKIDEVYETYGDPERVIEKIHKLARRYNRPTVMLEFEEGKVVNISYEGLPEGLEEEVAEELKDLYDIYGN